jgi:hypothetical protein
MRLTAQQQVQRFKRGGCGNRAGVGSAACGAVRPGGGRAGGKKGMKGRGGGPQRSAGGGAVRSELHRNAPAGGGPAGGGAGLTGLWKARLLRSGKAALRVVRGAALQDVPRQLRRDPARRLPPPSDCIPSWSRRAHNLGSRRRILNGYDPSRTHTPTAACNASRRQTRANLTLLALGRVASGPWPRATAPTYLAGSSSPRDLRRRARHQPRHQDR